MQGFVCPAPVFFMRYQHYKLDRYEAQVYRTPDVVRLQVALDERGEYSQVHLIPQPVGYPTWSQAVIADQVFIADNPGVAYLNPDGRWLGFEWLVYGDVEYRLRVRVDGELREYVIPRLPLASPAVWELHELHPYSYAGTAGTIAVGRYVGVYSAGGLVIEPPATAVRVLALLSVPHRIYRARDGSWRLQLFREDGTEYSGFVDLRVTFDFQSPYR